MRHGQVFGVDLHVGQRGRWSLKAKEKLGEGGFCNVYRAKRRKTEESYAMKVGVGQESRAALEEEARLHGVASSACKTSIVQFVALGVGIQGTTFYLTELCSQSLESLLSKRKSASEESRFLPAFMDAVNAVAALHSLEPPIVHRDVKASNLLYHPKSGSYKLADFGSAQEGVVRPSSRSEVERIESDIQKRTTPAYRAPEQWEVYMSEEIGPKVDVWALGCLAFRILHGADPFPEGTRLAVLSGSRTNPPWQRPEDGLTQLTDQMMRIDASARPTAGEVQSRCDLLISGRDVSKGGFDATLEREESKKSSDTAFHETNVQPCERPDVSDILAKHGLKSGQSAEEDLHALARIARKQREEISHLQECLHSVNSSGTTTAASSESKGVRAAEVERTPQATPPSSRGRPTPRASPTSTRPKSAQKSHHRRGRSDSVAVVRVDEVRASDDMAPLCLEDGGLLENDDSVATAWDDFFNPFTDEEGG